MPPAGWSRSGYLPTFNFQASLTSVASRSVVSEFSVSDEKGVVTAAEADGIPSHANAANESQSYTEGQERVLTPENSA